MESIPRRDTPALPDFCNLGVGLRILLIGNIALMLLALTTAQPVSFQTWLDRFVTGAAVVEPVLIASLVVLCPLRRLIDPLGFWPGAAIVIVCEMLITFAFAYVADRLDGNIEYSGLVRDMVVVALSTALVLYHFHLRERAFSPALTEARLLALQARIRPHFLFNSLTAVLSLIRSEPRRAERALEDLADLFRSLLREERRVVRLSDEIAVCRRYLDIEALRLGERLQVEWDIDNSVLDAAVPPLVLQPLVENAVHHGIEPMTEPGTVRIAVRARGKQLEIDIVNPREDGNTQPGRAGNHMAQGNVRERLALLFDLEARLDIISEANTYRVHIVLPVTRVQDKRGRSV